MKKFLLLLVTSGFIITALAQVKPVFNHPKGNIKMPVQIQQVDDKVIGGTESYPLVSTKSTTDDPVLMTTTYDFQTNGATQNRVYCFPDGTISATATMSHENTSSFTDRGTGYNYFDGTNWGTQPSTRIESLRTGWPSICPYGPNGEITIAHQSATAPLIISKRDTKGTGAWTQMELSTPAGASGMIWSRMITSGPDHTYIHVICLTAPTGNGGTVYQGLDGALVYNRSLDGGATWDGWLILDGMTSADYLAFGADTYGWAEPQGETICFVIGDSWTDAFLMKSDDNGDTWTKTLIWDCPWDLWAGPDTTGTFYCCDGSINCMLDNTGKAHVVFGLQRAMGDATGAKFWYPFTDGLIYWNEDMPELPQDLDPDVLFANGNYIGWVQDTMVWYAQVEELAYYYVSLSSYPTIVIDGSNQIFVVWSGVTTLRDANSYMLRHLFGRASVDGGMTWRDTIVDVTGDFLYTWSECVYPSAAWYSDDKLYIEFQTDDEAGVYLNGSQGAQGQTTITTNNMTFITPTKESIIAWPVGIDQRNAGYFAVSQAYPNPALEETSIALKLDKPAQVNISLSNTMGQQLLSVRKGFMEKGTHVIPMATNHLSPGVYFYTIKIDTRSVTRKLIVE